MYDHLPNVRVFYFYKLVYKEPRTSRVVIHTYTRLTCIVLCIHLPVLLKSVDFHKLKGDAW